MGTVGAQPGFAGTKAAPPPAEPRGWGGAGEWPQGWASRPAGKDISPGMARANSRYDPDRDLTRGYPQPRPLLASPTSANLERGHGRRAGCRGDTYLGRGQLQERGEQQAAEQGAHGARGGRAPKAPASP